MTNLNADNNTDEDADDWEDEGLDYSEEMEKLPLAVRHANFICAAFEMVTRGYFSWDSIPALQIHEVVSNLSWLKGYVGELPERGISKEELLRGIETFKAIKAKAQAWAQSLAKEIESTTDDDCDGLSGLSRDSSVDCFIFDVADDDDDLAHIRRTDPILFGEIGLETSRLLAAHQQT